MRFALVLLAALLSQAAAADEARFKALAVSIAEDFLAPAYRQLAEAARLEAGAVARFCATPRTATLEAVRQGFRGLALGFGRVQAFRYGPIAEGSTIERIYFWPERRNATAKGLATLMAAPGPITEARVEGASAAAQGIPALERLIFGEHGVTSPDETEAGRACETASAVAAGLARRTAAVASAWTDEDGGVPARLARGAFGPSLGATAELAASALVTGFLTTLAVIQDQKVEPILGSSVETARPQIAELRLSGLSTGMILANLAGLRSFVAATEGAADGLHRASWDALLLRLDEDARAMDGFPAAVSDPARRRRVEAFLGRLRSVRAILAEDVPVTLDLRLGFNALDGD